VKVISRETGTTGGHPDLTLEDKNGSSIVVEAKDETAKSIDQITDYMRAMQQRDPGKHVRGVIVCPDATPRLIRNAEQAGISVYFYMGKFHIRRHL